MASNYIIANSILAFSKDKPASEIDRIAKAIVKIYGHRAKTILSAIRSKQEMADTNMIVLSATVMSNQQKIQLAQALGTNQDKLIFELDTSLLGGVVVKIGDQIIDSSLATRITKVQDLLVKTHVN